MAQFCTCTCCPGAISEVATPMIWLYLRTKSPAAISRVAILWPEGMALAVTTPSPGMVAPAGIACAATTTLSCWCRRMVVPPMIWFIPLSSRPLLWSLGAGGVDVYRIERRGRRDKEAISPLAAEAHVGDDLRHVDAAEQGAVRGIALDAVVGAGPQVAGHVHAETIGNSGLDVAEHAAVGEALAVDHIEGADVAARIVVVRCRGIRDVEDLLVGREGKPVRLQEIVHHDRDLAVRRIDAIDVAAALLLLRPAAFELGQDAVAGVG